mgnify:CR=1 FL=1
MAQFSGKVWVLGDDIDTDIIIPTEYLALETVNDMAPYAFSPLRPELAAQIKEGDIIVAGKNFGCGSSREHAPIAIKTSGISCVIASTFARIFYRNAINTALPILECDEAAKDIDKGDEVEIDFDTGVITNKTKGHTYQAQPFPEFIKEIIAAGGLLNSLKK